MRISGLLLASLIVTPLGAQTRFTAETVVLRNGQQLDVDTGAVVRGARPGIRAELACVNGAIEARMPTTVGDDLAVVAPPASGTWTKLATDGGRVGWYEVIRGSASGAVLRVVTRVDGNAAPTAAPAGVLVQRLEHGVELRIVDATPRGTWLVERAGADGVFAPLARVTEPRCTDSDPPAGGRVLYRIARVDHGDDASLPVIVAVQPGSRARELELPAGVPGARGIDLCSGEVVDVADADLIVDGGALRDGRGFAAAALAGPPAPGTSLWRAWREGAEQPIDAAFVVPLRDGGFALGELRTDARGATHLRWELVATDDRLPAGVDLRGVLVARASLRQDPGATEPGQETPPVGGQESAPDRAVQEWLFARRKYDDYEAATFSFEHGIRDDADNAITHNDWDLQFGNGSDRFSVRMVVDDVSEIGVLPVRDWNALQPAALDALLLADEVEARTGAFYAVRTCDTETDLVALFRVAELLPGNACRIEWVALVGGQTVRHAPGLDPAAVGKATPVLQALAATVATRRFGLDDASRATLRALEDRHYVVDADPTVGSILAEIESRLGALDVAAANQKRLDAIRGARAPYTVDAPTREAALEAVLRRHGWRWWIGNDGRIAVAPR